MSVLYDLFLFCFFYDPVPIRRQVIGDLERGTYKGSLPRALDVLRIMGFPLIIDPAPPTLDELSDD